MNAREAREITERSIFERQRLLKNLIKSFPAEFARAANEKIAQAARDGESCTAISVSLQGSFAEIDLEARQQMIREWAAANEFEIRFYRWNKSAINAAPMDEAKPDMVRISWAIWPEEPTQ